MTKSRVYTVESQDADLVVRVMTLAFAADPAVRWLFPAADVYLEHFPEFVRSFGGRAFGCGSAFLTEGARGASMWLPPETHADEDAIMAVVQGHADRENLDAILALFEEMDEYHPEEPLWYLPMIGVDPARQGQGTGSRLLADMLERVDGEGMPAYLESSNIANVPLYQRFGFEVMGEIQHGDGPPVIPMYRAARS